MPESTSTTDVQTVITDALVKFGAEPEWVTREATFEELDIDSLDLVELSQIVEEQFGVTLKSSDVGALKTVGDAVDLVTSRLPG
jgi:acyl carrier protein